MFTVVFIAAAGIATGYVLRRLKWLHHVNTTITLTICFMLFVLGLSVGENRQIVQNLWHFGGQAIIISFASIMGSLLGAWIVYRLLNSKNKEVKK